LPKFERLRLVFERERDFEERISVFRKKEPEER
jgi:hypothetical protein